MDTTPRAFRIRTLEGSRLWARFDPQFEQLGILFGHLTVAGFSVLAGRSIRVVGIGALPEVGGRVVVDDQPTEILRLGGEEVPVFPSETINDVQEIPVPSELHDS